MKFLELANYFDQLEKTASRNRMTEILAELFGKAEAGEIGVICYLSLGRLVPRYESLEFQLAEKMMIRSAAQALGKSAEEIRSKYKEVGDLGEVVEKYKLEETRNEFKDFSVLSVYQRLKKVAKEGGEGSQKRKMDGISALIGDLDALSSKYVVRMVLGRLRLGFSDATILDALSFMKTETKEMKDDLERAYFVRADIGYIAGEFKKNGIRALSGIKAEIGVPVMPALCQRLKTADEMIKKMGLVAAEPKYDGQRVQIHYQKLKIQKSKVKAKDLEIKNQKSENKDWRVRAFTRNMEEVSFMFPELQEISKQIEAGNVILDSEAVGYDKETGRILPFQEIITRKRKHAIAKAAKKVPLRFYVFDILFKNDKSLLDIQLKDRVEILKNTVKEGGALVLAERVVTEEASELKKFHREQLDKGLEGAVVKKWDDHYIPGRRGWSWVKFKEAEEKEAKLADTLDCLVMGYYKGKGKRASFGIGGFLVGIRKEEKYLTLSKIGTGLSDDQWREMKKRADELASEKRPKQYDEVSKTLEPDVWVEPQIVVEIAADNITKSPVHGAEFALRFPRLVRFRDDKSVNQVSELSEVKRLYKLQ